jgi:hypothetical protein
VLPVAHGTLADLKVDDIFPRAKCFVQFDVALFAVRWTREHFVNLHTITEIDHAGVELRGTELRKLIKFLRIPNLLHFSSSASVTGLAASHPEPSTPVTPRKFTQLFGSSATLSEPRSPRSPVTPFSPRTPVMCQRSSDSQRISNRLSGDAAAQGHEDTAVQNELYGRRQRRQLAAVQVTYNDRGGTSRVLQLRMSQVRVLAWVDGLQALLQMVPQVASPAHSRWAISCMLATRKRRELGYLHESELQSLLNRANASADLSRKTINDALQFAEMSEHRTHVPQWLKSTGGAELQQNLKLLDVQQVMGLLVQMSTSCEDIIRLFRTYAVNGRLGKDEWLHFINSEQSARPHDHLLPSSQRCLSSDDAELLLQREGSLERMSDRLRISGIVVEEWGDERSSLVDFALRLLSPQNDAIAHESADMPPQAGCHESGQARLQRKQSSFYSYGCHSLQALQNPLSQYWIACSHNVPLLGIELRSFAPAAE